MTANAEAKRLLRTLVEAASGTLEPVTHLLDQPYTDQMGSSHGAWLEEIQQAAISGFVHCAARGITFAEESRVEGLYGASLEAVYPGASSTFMALARTYWTFKVVLLGWRADSCLCVRLLWAIDQAFAGVFFPTPGPFSPPKELREQTMRVIIRDSGAGFDEEDYIRGNCYLR